MKILNIKKCTKLLVYTLITVCDINADMGGMELNKISTYPLNSK